MLKDYALQFVGLPYRWGGTNPMTGFDCSGLVRHLLHSEGVHTTSPGNARDLFVLFAQPKGVDASLGALVFYGETPGEVNHVALCLDEHHHIEAAGGDHTCTTLERAIGLNAFVRVTPIRVQNRVAIVMPPYPHPVG